MCTLYVCCAPRSCSRVCGSHSLLACSPAARFVKSYTSLNTQIVNGFLGGKLATSSFTIAQNALVLLRGLILISLDEAADAPKKASAQYRLS